MKAELLQHIFNQVSTSSLPSLVHMYAYMLWILTLAGSMALASAKSFLPTMYMSDATTRLLNGNGLATLPEGLFAGLTDLTQM